MFFASEWILEQNGVQEIGKLYDVAADLNCVMWHEAFFTQEGFKAARFVIQVPSVPVFQTFMAEIDGLVFKNWKPIELDQAQVPPLYSPTRFSELSGNRQASILGCFSEYAAYNEALKQRK